jgi:hypothetical protein
MDGEGCPVFLRGNTRTNVLIFVGFLKNPGTYTPVERSVGMEKQVEKLKFSGQVKSVQPRIRLARSFDQTHHAYLGFALLVEGLLDDEPSVIWIGIGKGAQAKHAVKVGDWISGQCLPVLDPIMEPVSFYKVSKLATTVERPAPRRPGPPPWEGLAPSLETYRARGHRRLDTRTYNYRCRTCKWACRMPVEITVDHWNPGILKHRYETFCYGPNSCRFYKAGPIRKVPGRNGMVYYEEDWVDQERTRHRGLDE